MTGLARLLLVATTLAPMLIVAGFGWYPASHALSGWVLALAATLTTACHLLLWYVRRDGGTEDMNILKVARADKNVFPMLFTYVVPLLVPATLDQVKGFGNVYGLAAFVVILGLVIYRTQLHDVNPLLTLFGYHFFEVETGGRTGILLLTKEANISGSTWLRVKRISDTFFLECGSRAGSTHPATAPAAGPIAILPAPAAPGIVAGTTVPALGAAPPVAPSASNVAPAPASTPKPKSKPRRPKKSSAKHADDDMPEGGPHAEDDADDG